MDKVDIWSKIVVMLKNCLTHKILMKEKERPLLVGKNKKVIGLMKDEKYGKIIARFAAAPLKSYFYHILIGFKKMIIK